MMAPIYGARDHETRDYAPDDIYGAAGLAEPMVLDQFTADAWERQRAAKTARASRRERDLAIKRNRRAGVA